MISATLNTSRCVILAISCWCIAVVFCSQVRATVVEGLYDAKVEVSEQTLRAQKGAARDALGQVLVKVSGTREVLENKDVRTKLRSASDFMRAYRFDMQSGKLYFLASFDSQKIDQLIKSAGFPIWDSRRPDTLLWLAIEDKDNLNRYLLAEGADPQLTSIAKTTANSRGIEISFPLMDLEDLQRINLYDVWGRFTQNIEMASQRYDTDAVLSARIYQQKTLPQNNELLTESVSLEAQPVSPNVVENNDLVWVADWLLIQNSQTESGQVMAADAEILTAQLIEFLATNLAGKFAIDNQSLYARATNLQIKVSNVADLSAYVQVSRFLASLSLVNKATLVNQMGSRATFELQVRGKEGDLINALRLDETLQPKLDNFGMPTNELEFVWNP